MYKVIQTIKSNKYLRGYIQRSRHLRVIGTASSATLFLLALLCLFPVVSHLNSAEATIGTANPSDTTLNMTIDHSAASLDLVVRSTSGTFASSGADDTAKFSVTTNNYSGYILSIAGANDGGELTSASGASFTSIDSYTDADTFTNGSAAIYNGKWGYQPSKYNSSANTYFRPSPTTSASTLSETSSANASADDYSIVIGARADYSLPADTYTGTFTLTAVGKPIPYTISYLDNSGDSAVTGMPSSSTVGSTDGTSITLSDVTPSRKFYNFAGWCNEATTLLDDGGTSCAGDVFSAGSAFGLDQTTNNAVSLYAVWEYVGYTITFATSNADGIYFDGTKYSNGDSVVVEGSAHQISGAYPAKTAFKNWSATSGTFGSSDYQLTTFTPSDDTTITLTGQAVSTVIQDLSAATCTTTPTPVYDNRDNEVYWIAKLADDKCWMLDNLRLGSDSTINLTISNTNIASNWTLPAGITSGFNSYTDAHINVASKDKTTTSYGSGSGKIGVYYNYCAASAGTYCMAGGSGSGNASYDICPKGWRMPTGGSSGEYQALYTAYSNNATNFRNALSTPISGDFNGGSALGQGSNGYFWSSTYYNNNSMYNLRVYSSDVNPTYGILSSLGLSVRCVLQTTYEKLVSGSLTMQDIGTLSLDDKNALLSQMGTNYYTVKDNRDGQSYVIQKLADGNLWMMTNLNLGAVTLSTDLTSSNTNLSTTITASAFNGYKKSSGTQTYTAAEYVSVSGTDSTSSTPYGTLYNYCAASAGTICTDSNSSNTSYDICPKGWRLPVGNTSGEFQAIYSQSAYNSNAKIRKSYASGGAAFALAGLFINNTPIYQGSDGYYWSSTRLNTTYMHIMRLSTSDVYPADYSNRGYGHSIRCILKPSMQGFTSAEASAMTEGATKILTDGRDGQDYAVTKIGSLVWMTQNLRFKGTSISPTDTNIDTAKTISYGDLTSGNSYDEARIHDSGNATTGVWYNYAAASAMTITGSSNSTGASYSLCPSGWRLPTKSEQDSITSSASAFSPVTGGHYINGSLVSTGYGYWWSSTASNATGRYFLRWNGSSLDTSSNGRHYGVYIRCVRS